MEIAASTAGTAAPDAVGAWVAARVPARVVHLDVAAAGRVSTQVLAAEVAHLEREAHEGPYVAQAAAEPDLDAGRAALGRLLGLQGDDVALPANAIDGFVQVFEAWPLPSGARVGTVSGDYAPNAGVLRRLAEARGWTLVPLPVDRLGRVQEVPARLDVLTLPQVASQRGVAQPVDEVLASGVPVVLDVAQSLGQTPVPAGAAAYVGTSRKWLCGPRGAGFLAVDPAWAPRLVPPAWTAPHLSGMRRFDAAETHVAGRVGLAAAVQEWTPLLLPVVHDLAAHSRRVLVDTPWQVVEPVDEPTGITTLVPPQGVDVDAVRLRLLEQRLLTTAVPATRAADMTGPVLRVSTAAWVPPEALDEVAAALRA